MVARILAASLTAILLLPVAGAQESSTTGSAQDRPEVVPDTTSIADRFLIGVEDRLEISVYKHEDLGRIVTVRPDGRISLPMIQDVKVVGKTPEEVSEILKTRLSAYFNEVLFPTVIVTEIRSFRVYCLGEVKTPSILQLQRPTRILQAVASCGGPGEYAKGQITIIREEFGIERRTKIDYKKLLEGEPGQENLYLRPGDTLVFR